MMALMMEGMGWPNS